MKGYDFCEKDISGIGGGDYVRQSNGIGGDALPAMG